MTTVVALASTALVVAFGAAAFTLWGRPTLRRRVAPYTTETGDGSVGTTWVEARPRGRLPGTRAETWPHADAADEHRRRQIVQAAMGCACGVLAGGVVLRSGSLTLLLGASGAAVGLTRAPMRRARAEEERRVRMRLELVAIDQVLAIHVRSGAGPVQAVTRVVERGAGVVVDELRSVLASIRAGRSEAEAFRHAAVVTAEPHAARTYRLFALAAEQGADLGTALRALSDDLRDVRRDEMRRKATRRRAAMLLPTIAILAPIMLLFVIAPIPSLVLGGR